MEEYIYQHLKNLEGYDDTKLIKNSTIWGYKVTLIKMVDGNPISTISIGQFDSEPKNFAWLYELITDANHTRKGYATEMIHKALYLCELTKKIDTIFLKPDSINLASWYKRRFGFTECKIKDEKYLKLELKWKK